MADDTQWPSEDEDFDAVTDTKNTKTTSSPERKSVSVFSHDEPDETEHDDHQPDDSSGQPAENQTDAPDDDSSQDSSHDDHQDQDSHSAVESKPLPESNQAAASDSEPKAADTAHHDLEESEVSPEIAAAAAQLAKEEDASVADIALSPEPGRKSSMGRLFLEIILIMALAGVGYWALSLSSKNQDLVASNSSLKAQVAQLNANPQIVIQKQTDELISKVGALMQLPKGETPTVANVSDAAAAKKQSAFFNNAQNGDRVLMYVKAGQAILYRPSTNKIILVAPLTFSGTATNSTTTTKAKP